MSSEPPKKKTLLEEIPDVLPLLPIRDLVVFPYMIAPLRVSRPISLEAVTNALDTDDRLCFIVAQLGRSLQPELAMVLQSVEDPGRMADLVASNLTLKLPEAQGLLETDEPV